MKLLEYEGCVYFLRDGKAFMVQVDGDADDCNYVDTDKAQEFVPGADWDLFSVGMIFNKLYSMENTA